AVGDGGGRPSFPVAGQLLRHRPPGRPGRRRGRARPPGARRPATGRGAAPPALEPGAQPGVEGPPSSARVDLSWVRRGLRERLHPRQGERSLVAREGYVLFSNAEQATGYAVRVTRPEQPEGVFDPRELGADDLFAVTMVRPGT